MICLTFNCRGLANPDKRLALKELLAQKPIDILFLQETLGDGISVTSLLNSLLPNWTFITLDAQGRLGGCILGIKNRTTQMINCCSRSGVLGMDINYGNDVLPYSLINVYGPCTNREDFWLALLNFSLINNPYTIMGGDFNFSLGISESWGENAVLDPLAAFFSYALEAANLIDLQLTKIQPT